jgi:3-deoxy-D-manno-octulosonate 8-phosphate phosphatase (KDO 8-P phosphatase)
MDVDGVLTAGDVIVLDSGEEVKIWNSKDRLVLAAVRDSGLDLNFAFVTGRSSDSVLRTARELGVKHVEQGVKDKRAVVEAIARKENLKLDQIAFIGDDILDLPAMMRVGLSACPSDAVPDVRSRVHYISKLGGGRGAVRDVVELLLRAQKKWDVVLRPFLR